MNKGELPPLFPHLSAVSSIDMSSYMNLIVSHLGISQTKTNF